jgi:CubicO group peptidase (beta-lactamase class C family)
MSTTAFGHEALPAGVLVAAPYSIRAGGFTRRPLSSHALYPVVDLFSSAGDLARFTRAILSGGKLDGVRVLSTASVSEMLRVQLPDAAPEDALGWQVRTFAGIRVLGHEGEDAGASTGMYLDVASGRGAVVLANGDAFQGEDPARARAIAELVEGLLRASPER